QGEGRNAGGAAEVGPSPLPSPPSTREREKASASSLALAGLALGHAILTKATAYFFGFPFCLWLVIGLFRRGRWRSALASLALFAALVLTPNIPNYVRQTRTYGSPLGPMEEAGDPGQ